MKKFILALSLVLFLAIVSGPALAVDQTESLRHPRWPGRDQVTCYAEDRWGNTYYASDWNERLAYDAVMRGCETRSRSYCEFTGCR